MRNVVHGPSAKTIVKIVLSTAIILTTFYFAYAQSKPKTIDVNGRTRSYYLHVPSTYDGRTPVPLVLVLHGATQHAQGIERMSGMSAKADEQNFIAVYPAGTGFAPTWNAGNCCGYAQRNKVDDIDFLRVLIEKLKTEYNIDAKRVYATGISNGGMMSYRLACELADQIAAIGPVEGAQNITCNPSAPVSVIVFTARQTAWCLTTAGRRFPALARRRRL